MYQSVPAAAAMNRVPGFEPLNFLRMAVSEDTREKVWRLDLRYMKAWFRMARPNGRMKLKSLRITEQIAIFEAQVYMDRSDEEPFSNYIAQCTAEEAKSGDYIREAQDAALAVALNNAGFGIQFADLTGLGEKEQYGSEIPVSKEQMETPDVPGTAPVQMSIQAHRPATQQRMVQPNVQSAQKAEPKAQPSPQAAAVQRTAQSAQQPVSQTAAVQQKTAQPSPQPIPQTVVQKAVQPNPQPLPQAAAVQRTVQPAQQVVSQAAAVQQKATQSVQQPVSQAAVQKTVQPGSQQSLQAAMVQRAVQSNPQSVSQAATIQRAVQPTQQFVSQTATVQKAVQTTQQRMSQAAVQQRVAQTQPTPALQAQAVKQPVQQPSPQAATAQNVVQIPQTAAAAVQQPAEEHLPVMPEETCLSVGEQTASATAQPSEESLPITAESIPVKEDVQAQAAESGYMPGTPVEEILSRMTFEEAQKVVVDVGACKGWTMAEVADRRPPSLKYYVYGGYKGDNNILRAAAKIMLDSLEAKKAG